MGPSPRQGPLTDGETRKGTLWLSAKQNRPFTRENKRYRVEMDEDTDF